MIARAVARASDAPIARPTLGEAELDAVRRPLASGWLTQGPEVAAFEREFAAFVGAPHACAVSNCTTALHLALRAAGRARRRRGDHRQPLVHRHRERDPLLRRGAGLRRRPPGHLQHRPVADRGGDLARGRAPMLVVHQLGHAVRARRDRRDRPAPRAAGHRGRRVRRRQRDALERRAGSASAARTATSPASRFIRAR